MVQMYRYKYNIHYNEIVSASIHTEGRHVSLHSIAYTQMLNTENEKSICDHGYEQKLWIKCALQSLIAFISCKERFLESVEAPIWEREYAQHTQLQKGLRDWKCPCFSFSNPLFNRSDFDADQIISYQLSIFFSRSFIYDAHRIHLVQYPGNETEK